MPEKNNGTKAEQETPEELLAKLQEGITTLLGQPDQSSESVTKKFVVPTQRIPYTDSADIYDHNGNNIQEESILVAGRLPDEEAVFLSQQTPVKYPNCSVIEMVLRIKKKSTYRSYTFKEGREGEPKKENEQRYKRPSVHALVLWNKLVNAALNKNEADPDVVTREWHEAVLRSNSRSEDTSGFGKEAQPETDSLSEGRGNPDAEQAGPREKEIKTYKLGDYDEMFGNFVNDFMTSVASEEEEN
jgi:hypothetical protein